MNATGTATSLRWWAILTSVLGAGYLVIGMSSPLASIRWPTIAGGLLVLIAVWLPARRRSIALTLLLVGAAVPAALAWWSLVLPAGGILIVVLGQAAIRHREPSRTRASADGQRTRRGTADPVDRVRAGTPIGTGVGE